MSGLHTPSASLSRLLSIPSWPSSRPSPGLLLAFQLLDAMVLAALGSEPEPPRTRGNLREQRDTLRLCHKCHGHVGVAGDSMVPVHPNAGTALGEHSGAKHAHSSALGTWPCLPLTPQILQSKTTTRPPQISLGNNPCAALHTKHLGIWCPYRALEHTLTLRDL